MLEALIAPWNRVSPETVRALFMVLDALERKPPVSVESPVTPRVEESVAAPVTPRVELSCVAPVVVSAPFTVLLAPERKPPVSVESPVTPRVEVACIADVVSVVPSKVREVDCVSPEPSEYCIAFAT